MGDKDLQTEPGDKDSRAGLMDMSVGEFVSELSGSSPVPGGGGASALAGALGVSLGEMVANLTIGKPGYADGESELKQLKTSAVRIRNELLGLIQKDADAFGPLAKAYRMPTDTAEARESKKRVMEESLKDACLVPLEMMKLCAETIGLLERFAVLGNKLVLSDAACGAVLASAAARSAWLNVAVNTVSIHDADFAERVNGEGRTLMEEWISRAEAVYETIEKTYRRGGE